MVVSVISAVLIFQSLYVKNFFENAVLNQNEFQFNKYEEAEAKYGKNNVQALFFGTQPYFVVLYEAKRNKRINYKIIWPGNSETKDMREVLRNSKTQVVLLGDANPMQIEIAKEYYPYLIEYKQSLNVNYCLYSKEKGALVSNSFETILDSSDYFKPGNYEYTLNQEKLQKQNNSVIYRSDSLDEFPFSVKATLNKVGFKDGQMILAKMKLKSSAPLNDLSINYNITNKNDSSLFFGGAEIHSTIQDSSGFYAYSQIYLGSDYKKWIKEDCKITFFIWNRGKNKFTVTDPKIKTFDYWPARWSWWD
jgi:hypothetical protein